MLKFYQITLTCHVLITILKSKFQIKNKKQEQIKHGQLNKLEVHVGSGAMTFHY